MLDSVSRDAVEVVIHGKWNLHLIFKQGRGDNVSTAKATTPRLGHGMAAQQARIDSGKKRVALEESD